MSYFYPLKIDDCAAAALAIADYPLCVVELADGETGLALTECGMDLSWEICGAFLALGYLPPTHFCDLPTMPAMVASDRNLAIVAACRESLAVAGRWLESSRSRLDSVAAGLVEVGS